ncbi:unnamed protein product [Brachionus calyciflorus]|uniref:BZIP domain-containing protein n=1 Tax=Brachionus calyciflorus TaxID=104777 RepID=A0A814K3E1_9BILA|nr:unnamed protein product [Brachionus calyciflorus]
MSSGHFKKNWKMRMSSMTDEFESPSPSPVSSTSSYVKSEPKAPSSPGSLSSSSSTSSTVSNQSATSQIAAAMQALLTQPNATHLAAALQLKDSLAANLLQQIHAQNSPKSTRKPTPKRSKQDEELNKVNEEDEYEYDLEDNQNSLIDEENYDDEDDEEMEARERNNSTGSPTRSSSSQDQSRSISPSTVYNETTGGSPSYTMGQSGMDSLLAAGLGFTPNNSLLTSAAAAAATPGTQSTDINNLLNINDPSAAAALISTAALPTQANSVASLIASTRKRRTDRDAAAERVKKIKPVPDDKKDDAYWERRRKNNEAAKRSRDLRRMKEDEIAVRASFLEQENLKLKAQVTILKAELSKLHFMLYNR